MALASLTTEYRIPKREISAEVTLLVHPSTVVRLLRSQQSRRKVVRLFLSERAQMREGAERPSDLLNSQGEFLPAVEPTRRVILLNKDALMVLTVDADTEFPPEEMAGRELASETGTSVLAEIILQDGTELRGEVGFVMPEGKGRMVDFLNLPERFFALRDGAMARLVNKKCVVRVSIVGHESGE